jgi:antitoxin (DNA-binding transcriptional repressor) of toxin-antitoxin stability system
MSCGTPSTRDFLGANPRRCVHLSVTTIPAAGNVALGIAVGAWDEVWGCSVQAPSQGSPSRLGATKCYSEKVKTISQRELRNDNAKIIHGVELGETYTVTRRGVPVARLGPITNDSDLRVARPAKQRPAFAQLKRVTSDTPTETILAALRGER